MTNQEKQLHRKLENQLSSRGIFVDQWEDLENLRRKSLIERGENPDHWNLGDRYCSKKKQFREHLNFFESVKIEKPFK